MLALDLTTKPFKSQFGVKLPLKQCFVVKSENNVSFT